MSFEQKDVTYAEGEGPVRYLDASSLLRPSALSRKQLALVAALVAAAAVIGGTFLFNVIDSVVRAPEREEAAIQENLTRDVALDLPQLTAYASSSDADILQSFADAGFATYEISADENGFDVLKLPTDVSVEQAGLMYVQGISNLSATDASLLLNGSWRMTVDRTSGTDMRVRYADFTSGSVDAAVAAAIEAEGLGGSTMGESGTDDSGNTFQAGNVEVGGETYSWRVSAIALSSVYDISGLPEAAIYVGVRLTGPVG